MSDISSIPLWGHGVNPINMYSSFNSTNADAPAKIIQHSKAPITTGSSIVGVVYDKGVIIAGDTLASYGSLARFRECPRVLTVNENIIMGAGGDYADFQYVKDLVEEKIINEQCLDDGLKLKPKSLLSWLTRIMYNRRSSFNPLWNNLVVGGLQDGVPYLGTVDKIGMAYTDRLICTGFGSYIGTPLLRDAMERKGRALTKEEALELVSRCMEMLFYRDCRSFYKYQVAILGEGEQASVTGPFEIAQNWSIAHHTQ